MYYLSNTVHKDNFRDLAIWTESITKKKHIVATPVGFIPFNRMIGNPIHPNTGEPTDIFDYQEEYQISVEEYHKVILNKSRKIGATETALRIIAYNCFDHYDKDGNKIKGKYVGHHIMIVAGNKQSVANKFVKRFRGIFKDGFTDIFGSKWEREDLMDSKPDNHIEMFNGTTIEAYAASEAVRGEANVVCIFISEAAFKHLTDDSGVYKAVRPNISNIEDADFIMESTPNGRRGFFYDVWDNAQKSIKEGREPEFHPLEQPYTLALGKILNEKDIEDAKREGDAFFQQEFCCQFLTSGNQAFKEDEVIFKPDDDVDYFRELE